MVHLRSESICPLTGGGGLSADKMVGSPGPLLRTLLLRSSGFASKPPIMSSQSHPGASGPRIAVLTGPLGAMAAVYRPTEALPLSFQRQWDLGSLMGKLLVSEIHMHTRNYTHTHTCTSTRIYIRMYILHTRAHTHRTINTHIHECTHMHICMYTT